MHYAYWNSCFKLFWNWFILTIWNLTYTTISVSFHSTHVAWSFFVFVIQTIHWNYCTIKHVNLSIDGCKCIEFPEFDTVIYFKILGILYGQS